MLRASSDRTGRPVDLGAVADPFADPLLPGGRALSAFTDATVLQDTDEMPAARRALVAAVGEAGTTRAAAGQLGVQVPEHLLPT